VQQRSEVWHGACGGRVERVGQRGTHASLLREELCVFYLYAIMKIHDYLCATKKFSHIRIPFHELSFMYLCMNHSVYSSG